MAIFGKLHVLKHQLPQEAFQIALSYLESLDECFLDIKENESIKESLGHGIFVLKQAYKTKKRETCFFESHRKYVDIQYMVCGKEYMDVAPIETLALVNEYDEEKDFIKYEGKLNDISTLLIQEGELAIFYPQDGHQPCVEVNHSKLIYKAVIKIPVELL